jgi:hypothetical protein
MAFNHINFNPGTKHGALLRQMLTLMEQGDDLLADLRDVIVQMRDGADNPGDPANYAEVTKRFGFGDYDVSTGGAPTAAQNAKARAAFLEIDSVFNKRTGSVSGVQAARDQLYAFLR